MPYVHVGANMRLMTRGKRLRMVGAMGPGYAYDLIRLMTRLHNNGAYLVFLLSKKRCIS